MSQDAWARAKRMADQHMSDEPATPATNPDEFIRLPGLFRRWEFQEVLEAGKDFHIEDAGVAPDGTPLFLVFRREPRNPADPEHREEM